MYIVCTRCIVIYVISLLHVNVANAAIVVGAASSPYWYSVCDQFMSRMTWKIRSTEDKLRLIFNRWNSVVRVYFVLWQVGH